MSNSKKPTIKSHAKKPTQKFTATNPDQRKKMFFESAYYLAEHRELDRGLSVTRQIRNRA